jgi:amino acid transporter
MSTRPVFLRDATGLVREFSFWDSLGISLSLNGIWFMITYVSSTSTLMGGDPVLGLLLPLAGWFFIGLSFAIVSTVAPRTAGDYVFTTRYLNPALGFAGNAGMYFAVVLISGISITVVTLESFGLSPLFAYWGLLYNNPGLVSFASALETNPIYEFGIGGVLTVIFGVIPIFGNRILKAFNIVMFPLIVASVILMFGVLAVTPQPVALNMLNSLTGNPHFVDAVNAWGATNNNPPPAISDLGNTLTLNALYGFAFTTIMISTYYAGEIRQVKKTVPLVMTTTLVLMAVFLVMGTVLSRVVFGYTFLSNLYTESIVFGSPPLAVVPYLDFLVAAISPNVVVGSFIVLAPLIQMCWYQTNAVFIGSRMLFSYSMDRIMPSIFADVSEKYHVTVKGMLATLVLGLLIGIVFVLPSAGIAFLLSAAAAAIEFLFPIAVLGFAMLAFRYWKSKDFKASPIAGSYMGGPLYSISAVATIVFSLYTFYQYITIPALFGFAGTEGLELIFIPIVIIFAIYFISKFVNAKRGVPFDLIFKQIPPE